MPVILVGVFILAVLAIFTIKATQSSLSIGDAVSESGRLHTTAERLIRQFELNERDTGFFGEWSETELEGHRVAFQPGPRMAVYVGDFDADNEQLTDVYLGQVSKLQPMPEGGPRRLGPLLEGNGEDLARRFFLNADLSDDHPLDDPQVRRALCALSESVLDVQIYESDGFQLEIDPDRATELTLRSDVKQATAVVDALRQRAR
ncbi:MAG: hypothetical protein GY716_12950 [bacterium]|nr:hypothetical protein [bacterium]